MDNLEDIKKLIAGKEEDGNISDIKEKCQGEEKPVDHVLNKNMKGGDMISSFVPDKLQKAKGKKGMDKEAIYVKEDEEKKIDNVKNPVRNPYYLFDLPVKIKKLYPDVVIPEYKRNGDACCDIRAYRVVKLVNDMGVEISVPDYFDKITMYQGYKARIGTGFVLGLPDAWCANIEGRSGFSFDEGIVVSNAPGKAECIYKGEIMVNLVKIDKKPTVIHKNDRIAQIEIVPQYKMSFEETTNIVVEEGNERGEKGLGSSGVK